MRPNLYDKLQDAHRNLTKIKNSLDLFDEVWGDVVLYSMEEGTGFQRDLTIRMLGNHIKRVIEHTQAADRISFLERVIRENTEVYQEAVDGQ